MLAASQACVRAEKYFPRKGFLCRGPLPFADGNRLPCLFCGRCGFFMFRGRLKSLSSCILSARPGGSFRNLGMLNALTEHFDEAQWICFEQARNYTTV
ncbi:MAG: hypothetical protein ACLSHR_11580 [Oscillospiraceae bacterium]